MKTRCEIIVIGYAKKHNLVLSEVLVNRKWDKNGEECFSIITEDNTTVSAFRSYGMNRKWTTTFKVNGKVTKMNS